MITTRDESGRLELRLGDAAVLRPLGPDHVTPAYVEGLNDPVVHEFLEGPRRQIQTEGTVRGYVRSNADDDAAILFGFYLEDVLRGTIRLHDIDTGTGTAWIGIALFDRSVWGQGWGTRMIKAVATWADDVHSITSVRAGIARDNQRSARAFEKAGFCHDPDSSDDERVVWVRESPVT